MCMYMVCMYMMCVYVCYDVCVCVCELVCSTQREGQSWTLDVFFSDSPPYFWNRVTSLILINSARFKDQRSP